MPKHDIIVIGGGHAGIEAACVAAKMGASVLLVTSHADMIGQMSCNPAIGGVAKGNIVREIDALGGVMGSLIDRAGIHFRMLNRSKGSAVWGPRAQADKDLYRNLARRRVESDPNIAILQAMVERIDVGAASCRPPATMGGGTSDGGMTGAETSSGGKTTGGWITNGKTSDGVITGDQTAGGRMPPLRVVLDNGEKISAGAVVVAAGTFLGGVMHIGRSSRSGGRSGEPAAVGLTASINELGITSGRLNTGTPPRIDGRTVDYSKLTAQPGDDEPRAFSFFAKDRPRNKIVCWSTRTNAETHRHILDNIDRLGLRSGKSESAGPRYCPLIEDKIIRFGERDGHILYLEPEGLNTHEVYVNGLFTALPYDAQELMVRSVCGLENTRIVRPGYGIEYDFFHPTQLYPSLESRVAPGLFFAGQVNGTSGYEEAACQGLIAGINVVRSLRGEEPVVLGRETSYIGVLIDDLVTKGTNEPYRMFTSRAEHRLILRQDNCDERLMPIAFEIGTITREQYDERRRFWDRKREIVERLGGAKITPSVYNKVTGRTISQSETALDLLRRPEAKIEELLMAVEMSQNVDNLGNGVDNSSDVDNNVDNIDISTSGDEMSICGQLVNNGDNISNIDSAELFLGVESDVKYEGFVRKQVKDIERARRYEESKIPDGFCYDDVPGLLNESRQKLKNIRPCTLGQASRISGVTPADISVLAMYLCRGGILPPATQISLETTGYINE